MVKILVTDREGAEHEIEAHESFTLMEAIRESAIEGMLALCGGCCSCATCHVYIDQDQAAGLPPISADEDDLLDSSDHSKPGSRLACQISLAACHDGFRATVAPED